MTKKKKKKKKWEQKMKSFVFLPREGLAKVDYIQYIKKIKIKNKKNSLWFKIGWNDRPKIW